MEEKYPELAGMKDNEVFIEYAWFSVNKKIQLREIVKKEDLRQIKSGLKLLHGEDHINLITISK